MDLRLLNPRIALPPWDAAAVKTTRAVQASGFPGTSPEDR